jgi:hypothetical protein
LQKTLRKLEDSQLNVNDILDISSSEIGNSPHDDSTLLVMKLRIDPASLVLAPPGTAQQRRRTIASSVSESSDAEPATGSLGRRAAVKRRTHSNDGKGTHLDYLFS